jgi:N,N'-diacetyllegionaminate synthase
MPIKIGDREIGPSNPPFIIAEVAQTHEGSLGNALAFIDIAKECGCDAIKFQTHLADEESTPSEPWRIQFSIQDTSRYKYWERIQFTYDQWSALKRHADQVGIHFISSPFSLESCRWLSNIGVSAWKLASGEVNNPEIIDWMSDTGLPIIASSGLSQGSQIESTVCGLIKRGSPFALLHCTTKYPTPPNEIGLNILEQMIRNYPSIPIGLSDHSGSIVPAIISTYLGATIIEIHITMHKRMFGPDVSSSHDPESLATLVSGVREAWEIKCHPVNKEKQLDSLNREIQIFGRSWFTKREITAGTTITEADIAYKKPGGGLGYENKNILIGKRAAANLPVHHKIQINDVFE